MRKEFILKNASGECPEKFATVHIDPETKRCVFCEDGNCGLFVGADKPTCPVSRVSQ